MRPAELVLNPRDMAGTNSVFGGNVFVKSLVRANGKNLLCSQFGCAAPFASIVGSVKRSVGFVFFGCSPAKVGKTVVSKVAVVMAALLPWLWLSDKRYQYKPVNLFEKRLSIFPKQNLAAQILFVNRWLFKNACSCVLDIAKVRHFVKTLKSNNRFPDFHAANYPTHAVIAEGVI